MRSAVGHVRFAVDKDHHITYDDRYVEGTTGDHSK